jgi:hypothetical protein
VSEPAASGTDIATWSNTADQYLSVGATNRDRATGFPVVARGKRQVRLLVLAVSRLNVGVSIRPFSAHATSASPCGNVAAAGLSQNVAPPLSVFATKLVGIAVLQRPP